jgi:integrase/recombinase XerD
MAEGLTSRSIESYERILNKWLEYVGDVEVKKISSQEISGYMTWLRTDYIPHRFSGKTHPLSPKTMRNIWIILSSFFTWAK